ncbi:hypothetical protein BDY19DRAFT_992766 [Irpex rosettiformis]|uniref:Uncharacterized protein n=1 Tax=Irpex rosettiformis TaxID=378272 RepID=A0ACB8U667_9APHY|nr:hypothetical protein BDY19DRAFT_992766 [Irpex rosettiformis]
MSSMKEVPYTHRSTRSVLTILDPALLQNPEDVSNALEELARKISEPATNLPEIVREICSAPNLFEVVLSGLEETAAEKVVRALKLSFPESDAHKYQSSSTKRLLLRLASYFSSLETLPENSIRQQCQEGEERVTRLHCALDVLSDFDIGRNRSRVDGHQAVVFDETAFDELGIECPKTVRDAQITLGRILKALKSNLDFFLMLLRNYKWLAGVIQERYFRASSTVDVDTACTESQGRTEANFAGLHTFSRKKTALVMAAVDGFGDYRILMSSRVVRDIKTARSRPRLYSAILNTFRLLSRNELQAKVLSTSDSVTIFATEAYKGHSVVYCTDEAPSLYSEGTEEVFRVFGIFNASALEGSFWEAFAIQIAARRAQMKHAEPSVHTQDLFSDMAVAKASQYVDKMRSLLVITKFVDLSQSVLEAIKNDTDITQAFELSPQEQEMLEYNGSCYVLGRSGTGKTTVMMMKMLATESTFHQYPEMMPSKPRQLFVTRSQNLASKVKESFDGMYQTHILGSLNPSNANDFRRHALVDADEEEMKKCKRFGELVDDDFPLFLSFDHLCSMIEEELRFACPTWRGLSRDQQISYDMFLYRYWPELYSSALQGIDPSLVFGQFIGVIEGSEGSLSSPSGYISREEYVNMSRPSAITQAQDRHRVYDLFEKYKRLKAMSYQHDIANRTHAILRGLVNAPSSLRGTVDFLFVDEAQDNLLIDTRLLRFLCNNPNGLFWAGDTAQTVFAGSAFTFNELKAFMWRTERESESEIALNHKILKEPVFFELTVNFRSQQGILACAQSVLDCISAFWPATVDRLPKEEGLCRGKQPIMFVRQGGEEDLLRLLVRNASGSVELGAEQCIIVRDEAARDNARKATEGLLDDTTQILTLYESKGLEYNDVILYNFFEDSHCDWFQWRHLLNQHNETANMSSTVSSHGGAKFDALSRELKSLYVGCTRAKHNLWIIDTSEKTEAVRRIWEKNNEIDWQENYPDVSEFASASSRSTWQRKAYEYFVRGHYDLARRAYLNAGLLQDAAIASAYMLREYAELTSRTATASERSKRYSKAANAFDQVASETAEEEKLSYYRIAAECFMKVPDNRQAAIAFDSALDYNQAIRLHRDVGNFERTVQLLCENKNALQPDSLLKVQYASLIYCLLNRKIGDAYKISPDNIDLLAFACRHGLKRAEATLLEHHGNLLEAVRRRLCNDQFVGAANLLKRLHPSGRDFSVLASTDLLLACRRHISIATIEWSDAISPTTNKMEALLGVASLVCLGSSRHGSTAELDVFRAIALHDEASLGRLALEHSSGNNFIALICFSRIIRSPTQWKGKAGTETLQWLKTFLPMSVLLRNLCFQKDPHHNPSVQLVLGFRCVTHNIFHLLPGSAIEKHALAKKTPFMELGSADEYRLVSRDVLRNLLSRCMSDSLRRRVYEVAQNLRWELKPRKRGSVPFTLQTALQCLVHTALLLDDTRQLVPADDLEPEKRNLLREIYRSVTSIPYDDNLALSLDALLDVKQRDVRKGIHIVQVWLRESRLVIPMARSPNRATDLMKAFILFFAFRVITPHPYNTPENQNRPKLRQLELTKVEADFQDMVEGRRTWSPRPLLCLISSITARKIPVNIDVLCSTIEFMTGWLSLLCSQAVVGNVAGTVLSKRCLVTYGQGVHSLSECSGLYTNYSRWLVLSLAVLLPEILSPRKDKSAFLYSGRFPMLPTAEDRHGYIARLCEAFILLGHNVPANDLRADILIAITSIRDQAKQFPKIYKGYIAASTWKDLTAALPGNLPLVELVQTPPFSAKNPTYKAANLSFPLTERQLSGSQMAKLTKSALAKVVMRNVVDDSSHAPLHGLTKSAGVFARTMQRISDALDKEAEYHLREIRHPLRVLAATHLQRFYRRRLSLRRQVAYGSLNFLVSGAFEECLKEVDNIKWKDRRYRMVFLGILPHALACLDAIIMQFEHMKTLASNRLQNSEHSKWEELGHAVTAIDDELQVAKALRDGKLGPNGRIYRQQLWKEFRDVTIREIPKLMVKLPQNVIRDIEVEWSIVRKAVVQPGKRDVDWVDAPAEASV